MPVLDDGWAYLLVGMVIVHDRLVLNFALVCLGAAKLELAMIACAHVERPESWLR